MSTVMQYRCLNVTSADKPTQGDVTSFRLRLRLGWLVSEATGKRICGKNEIFSSSRNMNNSSGSKHPFDVN